MLLLFGLLLTACASPSLTTTTPATDARLPTRLPTPTPTATPFAISAEDYYERGVERQRAGDLPEARRYFTWAIERDPAFAPAYVSRGSIYLAEGDLDQAVRDVDAALEIEQTAGAYVLYAEILRAMEHYARAWRAFGEAVARDPSLKEPTFRSRWAVAKALEDEEHLSTLADEYATAHPNDWLRHYHQSWASLEAQEYEEAIATLVEGIEDSRDRPAILWYLLGRGYIGIEAWREAATSLETAQVLVRTGDNSMAVHTEQPVADLFLTLGRAYLGAGRCADAEAMLSYGLSVGASTAEDLAVLEQAQICQTPTPAGQPTPGE